ncbi:MAG: preprotein translocase subunit SecY [Lentisphaeria bacterium]|nr:preprotein translocase subunit SecY [Lentisphaeria bacterium]
MFKAFINAFKIKDLRNKILFSAAVIIVCRIAANIPCPGVNTGNLKLYFDKLSQDTAGAGGFLGMIDLFSGGALQQFAVGALGIMPYISASIIMQLLVPVLPALERLKREGEAGMNKINQYTRYLTIVICVIQGAMTAIAMTHPERLGLPAALPGQPLVSGNLSAFVFFSVIILTCGTMILMWLGEKITDKGIGNGVSIIITIGIIDRLPKSIAQLYDMWQSGGTGDARFRTPHVLLLIIIFAVVTALTIILCQGVRKVPIQMARKTVGNKVAGGSTYMPLKVNFPGVMPIIFAGAILMFPPMILRLIPSSRIAALQQYFNHGSYAYMLMYGALIIAFSYFWVSNMFNPVQIADNLKKEGAYVPGIRPGKPTCDYLDDLMTLITFAGAIFLCALSIFPMLLTMWLKIPYAVASFFGGTSLLIIVGVTIDTLSQMESLLVMKNYEGFLQRGRLRSRRG